MLDFDVVDIEQVHGLELGDRGTAGEQIATQRGHHRRVAPYVHALVRVFLVRENQVGTTLLGEQVGLAEHRALAGREHEVVGQQAVHRGGRSPPKSTWR